MLPNDQFSMYSGAQTSMLANGQPATLPDGRRDRPRRRVCGGVFEHPAEWHCRTGITIFQVKC